MARSTFLKSLAVACAGTVLAPSRCTAANKQMSASDGSKKGGKWEESISSSIAGATLSATKTTVKYPLDTAAVRLQIPNSGYSLRQPWRLLQGSFEGISLPLLFGVPGGAVFFFFKDAAKEMLLQNLDVPRSIKTSIAVSLASFPYWLLRNPSEVVKTRQQAGMDGYGKVSAWEAIQQVRLDAQQQNSSAVDAFYAGYGENVLYAIPADVIKFVAYDQFSGGRKDLSPGEGAVCGALATMVAQFITTPLDVVRNREMTGNNNSTSYLQTLTTIAQNEGLAGLFTGWSPRVSKAVLSGAIQFATYEETKQKMTAWFQNGR